MTRVHKITWLVLAIGLSVVSILPMLSFSYATVDLAEHIYHAREFALGRIPYRDIFSHHFLGYLIPFCFVQMFAPLTPGIVWTIAVAFNLLSAFGVCLILRKLTGDRLVVATGLLCSVTIGWFYGWSGMTFNNQSVFIPLLTLFIGLSVCTLTKPSLSRLFFCSLIFGLSICFDQRLLLFGVCLAWVIWASYGWSIKAWAVSALSFSVIPALILGYLVWNGAINDFWHQTFYYPIFHRNSGSGANTIDSIKRLLAYGIISERGAVIVAALGFVLMTIYERRAGLRSFFALTLISCLCYVFAGGRDYPNYLIVFTPVTLVLLSLAPWYLPKYMTRAKIGVLVIVAFLGLKVLVEPFRWYYLTGSLFYPVDERAVDQAANYIRANSAHEDPILVWGYSPAIYLKSERFSGFSDISLMSVAGSDFFSLDNEATIVPEMETHFKDMLAQKPPKFIVLYRPTGKPCEELCSPPLTDFSRTFVMDNLDFNRVERLKYFKEILEKSYSKVAEFYYPLDEVELYQYRVPAS